MYGWLIQDSLVKFCWQTAFWIFPHALFIPLAIRQANTVITILGLTSTRSSGRAYTRAPIFRAIEMAYLAKKTPERACIKKCRSFRLRLTCDIRCVSWQWHKNHRPRLILYISNYVNHKGDLTCINLVWVILGQWRNIWHSSGLETGATDSWWTTETCHWILMAYCKWQVSLSHLGADIILGWELGGGGGLILGIVELLVIRQVLHLQQVIANTARLDGIDQIQDRHAAADGCILKPKHGHVRELIHHIKKLKEVSSKL